MGLYRQTKGLVRNALLSAAFLATSITVGTLSVASGSAIAGDCQKSGANAIFRCKYTKGRGYAPYAGKGPKPRTEGKRKNTGEGRQYIKYGKFKRTGLCTDFGPGDAGEKCRGSQDIRVTNFYSPAETRSMISRTAAKGNFAFDIARDTAGAAAIATAFAFRDNPARIRYLAAGAGVLEIFISGGRRAFTYFISDKNLNTVGRGLCYYTITKYTRKGIISSFSGRPDKWEKTNGETRKIMHTGWYANDLVDACRN